MIGQLKNLSPAHIWLLSIAASLIIMESIAGGMGMLLQGEITRDHLLMGFVVSLFTAGIMGGLLTFLLAQQERMEAALRPAVPGFEVHEDRAPADVPAFEEAEEISHDISRPGDREARGAAQGQAGQARRNDGIRRAIQNLDVLPAMPLIAQRLLALNLNTEEGERSLLSLIGQDPQISAKIIGLANSALVGASRNVTSVRNAAILLGSKRIQSVATGIAILSLMAKPPAGEFNIQDLWLHSLRVAFAGQGVAQFIPSKMRPLDDQIFLAGMLHDIGYLVLAYLDPTLSDRLHNRLSAEPWRPALEIEREIMDTCHDELGAELARHWNLPEEIVAVLRYHHSPEEPEAAIGQPLVRLINLAQKLLPAPEIAGYAAPGTRDTEWEALDIAPSLEGEVRAQVAVRVEQAAQLASSFA
jgi:HD-like signal output (HDOD) protein